MDNYFCLITFRQYSKETYHFLSKLNFKIRKNHLKKHLFILYFVLFIKAEDMIYDYKKFCLFILSIPISYLISILIRLNYRDIILIMLLKSLNKK